MLKISMLIKYPILTVLSTGKKSFENLGRLIKKSGSAIVRILQPAQDSLSFTQSIAQSIFKDKGKLYAIIDDTLIKKFFSMQMQGSGRFYDTKLGKMIMAYKLVLGVITDGKCTIPLYIAYLFSKELVARMDKQPRTKEEIVQEFVKLVVALFPNKKIIFVADGLYATLDFIHWCIENNIALEVRMHSNRVIIYNGSKIRLREIIERKGIRPKSNKMARTISVTWHDLELEITIVRRIDKHGEETIVFQASTYKNSPREHVKSYKMRWNVEKLIRTTKQYFGLQECFSKELSIQENHVAAVLLSYTLAQLEMKKNRLKNPEDAVRRLRKKNVQFQIDRFARNLKTISTIYA
jgi:Transposase DDE domain group 1